MLAVVFLTAAVLAVLTGLLVVSEVIERALDADAARRPEEGPALRPTRHG
jgi:hypothetical protein